MEFALAREAFTSDTGCYQNRDDSMSCRLCLVVLVSAFAFVAKLKAEEKPTLDEAMRSAIRRAIPLIEKGAAGSAEKRTCFTCHSQALPVLALTEAKQHGFEVDEANLKRQLDHTFAHLGRGKEKYLEGKGQGGRVITAGYALWALEAGEHEPDETTEAVTSYLLQYQSKSTHWRHPGSRPPSSGSDFTTTYVALRGLAAYGTDEQEQDIESRFETVRKWLLKAKPAETEDRVFRLRSLKYVEADEKELRASVDELIREQREDGGWAQNAKMKSDAYATSTTIVALLQAGGCSPDDACIQRGLQFLISAQLDDGSWHVVTRAKPFQTYYESGFPHEKDQFISIAASCWSTLALTLSLPKSK